MTGVFFVFQCPYLDKFYTKKSKKNAIFGFF